jgi:methionyl-tRNA synthetase
MDILDTIRSMFAYEKAGNDSFSKDTYADSFETFQQIARDFDEALQEMYTASVSDADAETTDGGQRKIESFCKQISEYFTAYIQETEQNMTKGERERRQRSHNIFMATYVLPHIMEMRNPYYKELAKAIEKSWAAAFKNSKIKAASYETVAGGFQKKFFGFNI